MDAAFFQTVFRRRRAGLPPRRRGRLLCLCLSLLLLLSACAGQNDAPESSPGPAITPLRIVIASDLHYLSPSLTDNGPLFQTLVEQGDGKLMLDIEAITEAFVEQMLEERPDAVVLSGDLSFNGELKSHEDLAEKLRRLADGGIPVFVIPGNHDVRRGGTYRFEGESYEPVAGTSAEDFWALYGSLGRQLALSADEASCSYVCELGDSLRLLLLDVNSMASNRFPEESLAWLERELRDAREAGRAVVTVSHQNLLIHNGRFVFGYQIANAGQLQPLLQEYGVLVNLSGHMHIQHYLDGDVPELLTSPLSLVPCRYGLLTWDASGLLYEAKSVDVSAWAERHGRTEEHLLRFADYAAESFYQNAYRQIMEPRAGRELPEGAAERMARCFAETNLAYFTGAPLDRGRLRAELDFWEETEGERFETAYLRGILEDESPDPLRVRLWSPG